MRQKQLIIVILLLILTFSTSLVLSETHEQDISIIQMVHTGSNLMITLDYDISAAPGRGEIESLVVLVLLTIPEGDFFPIVGSLLFIRTNTGDRLLYWVLDDPYSSTEIWQEGMENVQFQVDYTTLSLVLIEAPEMENPNVELILFAKLLDIGNVGNPVTNFQPILERFTADIEFIQAAEISESGTTTTTKAKGFPGFQVPLSVGLLIFIGLMRRTKKK